MNKALARVLASTVALGSISVAATASAQAADDAVENAGEIVVTAQRRAEALEKAVSNRIGSYR